MKSAACLLSLAIFLLLVVSGGASVAGELVAALILNQQTQPPLDISGIAIIQALPIGKLEVYDKETSIKILNSIANLAVMQFDVEGYTIKAVNPYTKQEETVIGGEFGRILRHEILGINPKRERLGVKHIELVQTPGLTPKFDEDKFKLDINGREIELILLRLLGRPDKGFPEWGVRGLVLKMYVPNSGNPPKTEERDFSIDPEGTYYTIRILAPDGRLLEWKKWKFVPGNPNPVGYWQGKG